MSRVPRRREWERAPLAVNTKLTSAGRGRYARCLLLGESERAGVWKRARKDLREYDPMADRLSVVREKVYVMRASCTHAQVNAFRGRGEALLAEMGKALNQEAVAYETRGGLTILML